MSTCLGRALRPELSSLSPSFPPPPPPHPPVRTNSEMHGRLLPSSSSPVPFPFRLHFGPHPQQVHSARRAEKIRYCGGQVQQLCAQRGARWHGRPEPGQASRPGKRRPKNQGPWLPGGAALCAPPTNRDASVLLQTPRAADPFGCERAARARECRPRGRHAAPAQPLASCLPCPTPCQRQPHLCQLSAVATAARHRIKSKTTRRRPPR